MSKIRMLGFQTVPKSEQKPVQISARSDFGHLGFTMSEIIMFKRAPLASKCTIFRNLWNYTIFHRGEIQIQNKIQL